MKKKENWKKIETEYLKGTARKVICDKYNITYNALDSRIKREKWKLKKTEIDRKVTEKTVEKITDTLADEQARCLLETKIDSTKYLQKALSLLDVATDGHEVKLSIETYEKAIKLKRQALQIKDTIVAVENDIEKRIINVNVFS